MLAFRHLAVRRTGTLLVWVLVSELLRLQRMVVKICIQDRMKTVGGAWVNFKTRPHGRRKISRGGPLLLNKIGGPLG